MKAVMSDPGSCAQPPKAVGGQGIRRKHAICLLCCLIESLHDCDDFRRQRKYAVHVVLGVGDIQCAGVEVKMVEVQGEDFAAPATCPPAEH